MRPTQSSQKTRFKAEQLLFEPSQSQLGIANMKARQCAKIADLRRVLSEAGYHSLDKQAAVLGLGRSTTWAILQANHKSSGLTGSVIKRMLRCDALPPTVKLWIEEYVADKLAGAYGHKRLRLRTFRTQIDLQEGISPPSLSPVLLLAPGPALQRELQQPQSAKATIRHEN